MRGSEAGSVVAVEILVVQNEVFPVFVGGVAGVAVV
jgi:hypothetical protein